MRTRFVLLAFLTLAVAACAAPQDHGGRTAAAATAAMDAAPATAARKGPAQPRRPASCRRPAASRPPTCR
jgi:hypothetical protein